MKLTKMQEQEDMDAWEFEKKNWKASLMNDQLCNFPCLNLKGEALTMVKNIKMKIGVNGAAGRSLIMMDRHLLCNGSRQWRTPYLSLTVSRSDCGDSEVGARHLQIRNGDW